MKLFSGYVKLIRSCWPETRYDGCYSHPDHYYMPEGTRMPKDVDYPRLRRAGFIYTMCFCNEDFCNGEWVVYHQTVYLGLRSTILFISSPHAPHQLPSLHDWRGLKDWKKTVVFFNPFRFRLFSFHVYSSYHRFCFFVIQACGVQVSAVSSLARSEQSPQLHAYWIWWISAVVVQDSRTPIF